MKKNLEFFIRLPGKLKYLLHNIYLHSKMSPVLSTTDTYRFYFVKRETVLLVDGELHGLKMTFCYKMTFVTKLRFQLIHCNRLWILITCCYTIETNESRPQLKDQGSGRFLYITLLSSDKIQRHCVVVVL